jgi:AraC-like DNA-binding protein
MVILINFLTFPIMSYLRSASSPANVQRQIERLSHAISAPVSYLHGRKTGNPHLPANLLCFVRHDAAVLTMPHLQYRLHQHHRFVLIVALQGTGRVCVDVDTFPLQPGQAQLVFPFQFHSYFEVEPERICWLFITFEMDSEDDLAPLRSSGARALGPHEWPLLAEFVRGWLARAPVRFLQLQLAMLLARLALRKSDAKPRGARGKEPANSGILALVNRYVLPRLDRPIVLNTMAAALGQSESHLRRRFRLATGFSLGRHLRELRLRRACSLLHNTSLPVGDIATRCGFESVYAFSRAFRNELEVSPRAYRSREATKDVSLGKRISRTATSELASARRTSGRRRHVRPPS